MTARSSYDVQRDGKIRRPYTTERGMTGLRKSTERKSSACVIESTCVFVRRPARGLFVSRRGEGRAARHAATSRWGPRGVRSGQRTFRTTSYPSVRRRGCRGTSSPRGSTRASRAEISIRVLSARIRARFRDRVIGDFRVLAVPRARLA